MPRDGHKVHNGPPEQRASRLTRRDLLQGATAAGAVLALGKVAGCSSDDEPPAVERPSNVIVILADDMRHDELEHMPNVVRHLGDAGVTFTGARHNIAQCSPARAGFLTGQYSIRHRIRSQTDGFAVQNDSRRTIGVWMQAAGYRTAVVGKYFTGGNRPAEGWDVRRQLSEDPQLQYGFTVWDGTEETAPDVDQTQYLRDEVLSFLETAPEPFFLWFTPTANHWPIEPPPGHEDDTADIVWPDDREDDVSDKPPWIRGLPPLDDAELRRARVYQRGRISELLGLDDTVGALFDSLDARGVLDRTVVMFSSDNGVFVGEHRIPLLSKNFPYEPAVRVPCLLRAPGLEPGVVRQPAQMAIDLTATCVAVADAQPDLALDGVSLLEIAARPADFDDRHLLYDRDDRDNPAAVPAPAASGVFTASRKLVRYDSVPPTYELYDLDDDPDELENRAADPAYAEERGALEADLDALLST
jgi:N-acetylglucosamine-6-sulfatase